MNRLSNILKNNNLHNASIEDIKMFFINDKETYSEFVDFWKILDPNKRKTLKYKTVHTIAAFPKSETIKEHIEQFLIDSEGEVSPSKICFLNKINPEFNNTILKATDSFPSDFKIVGRCELLRKDIFIFPNCINCENPVSWTNSSKLLTFCSKRCADNSQYTKEKRKTTMNNLYGVDHYVQNKNFIAKTKKTKSEKYGDENYTNREKFKLTCLTTYGVNNILNLKEVREKIKSTMKEKYGVENYVEHSDFKKKSEITCMRHFGYRSQVQSPEIYQKILNSLYRVKKYKNTDLIYQGTYELYFLEQMEEKGFLYEISNSKPYPYLFNNKQHVYNPDFEFRGKIIEIKSTWTYNRNGSDKILELKNNTKWDAVKNQNREIVILIEKKEILNYINSID